MKYNLVIQRDNWTDSYAQGDNLFQICDLFAIKTLADEYYRNIEVTKEQKDYLNERIKQYEKDYKESPWQQSSYDKYVNEQMYGKDK